MWLPVAVCLLLAFATTAAHQVVFVVGVEGVGHHGLTAVLKHLSLYMPQKRLWWGRLQKSMVRF